MKIFTNRNVKMLFLQIFLTVLVFAVWMTSFATILPQYAIWMIPGGVLLLCGFLWLFLFRYFSVQNRMLEDAARNIEAYLSGNHQVRLEAEEEGELYHLLHEVNTLAAVLNAHAENESRKKQSLRDTIADISHQLKTPLAALNIYVGILQGEARDLPNIREFIDLSEQELDRIEALVQNLLKIAKLDAGTIVFEKQDESISEMMHAIGRQFALRSQQEEKKLELSGEEDLHLLCDRTWLMEALSNLVKNAFDHTKAGDIIQIAWKRSASMIYLTVKDNGCGIHLEDIYHIFKRFYRSRFSKDTRGVGLGLPLAKAVIEAQGGTITVDSELQVGTTFTIGFLIPTKL